MERNPTDPRMCENPGGEKTPLTGQNLRQNLERLGKGGEKMGQREREERVGVVLPIKWSIRGMTGGNLYQ